ncbi:PEP-CTERM sorting domain-containing protein [Pirellulales bacterium]|nr:PEP-CTERM sorting domain-containing protein [Pirellulales bacterium]
MTSDIGIHRSVLVTVLVTIASYSGSAVLADHIAKNMDLQILRTPLGDGQGYLNFAEFSNGAEYTGFTNGNETFRDGGQDISDNSFTTKVIIVTDANGDTTSTASGVQFEDDTEFTRKVWAQAGLSMNIEGVTNVNSSDFSGIGTFPIDASDRFLLAENGAGRSANAKTMHLYYAKSFAKPGTLGTTRNAATGGPRYIFLQDGRDSTTAAHEIGHMLFNGSAVHMPVANDIAHSSGLLNLMFPSSDAGISSLPDIGPQIGIADGGHAKLEPSQIQAVHGNTGANNPGFVSHGDNSASAGDMADFNWVADHELIERISGDSNSADLRDRGQDFLIWEINAARVMTGTDRGHKAGKLDAQAYDGSSFNAIDVFSNINRYADNDFTPGADGRDGADPEPIRRAKALDYGVPEFSLDGIDWEDGALVNVFKPGWTNAATSDNYVARWTTDLEAQFVRIARIPVANDDGHDGNAQIDAIMAVQNQPVVLEPVTFNGGDDAIIDIGQGIEWDQGSVNRPDATGKGKIENGGFVDQSFAVIDITGAASDSISGPDAGTRVDIQWDFDNTSGDLPSVFQGVFPLALGGPDLSVDLSSGTLDDVGHIVPFGDGMMFDINVDPDGEFFDILFQLDVDDQDQQLMQVHGEILADGLSFDDAAVQIFPPFPDNPSSLVFGLLFANDGASLVSGESLLLSTTMPLFSISIAGAITAIPEPSTLAILAGLSLLMVIRRHRE